MLERGLSAARDDSGGVVLVQGDPGMGKSALAAEVVRLAHTIGMRTCWGSCREGEGAGAYRPWRQILTGLGAPADLLSAEADSRFRLFDDVVELLRDAALPDGLLIVLDDVHWADVPSLRLLHVLAGELAGSRVFVLALHRRAEVYPRREVAAVLAAILRERTATSLPLGPLSANEVAELASHTRSAVADQAVLAAVQRRAEGNPLFVVELVRFAAVAQATDLPASVREVIANRLQQLPPDSRDALRAASVLGREYSAGQLAAVTSLSVAHLSELMGYAQRAELVGHVGGQTYRFAHVLIQEVAYAELPSADRHELHLRAARSVRSGEGADLPAFHLRQAAVLSADPQLLAEALAATVHAARNASAQLAYEQAAEQCREALQLLPQLARAPVTRAELLLEVARCEFRSGAVADAWNSCQAAADLGRAHGDAATVAQAALVVRGLSNDPICDQIHALCREALAMVGADQPVLRARLLGQLAVTTNQWAGGVEPGLSEQALVAAEATGDADARFLALQARHVALTDPRYTLDRLSLGERAVQLGGEAGREDCLAWGHVWRADAFWQLNRRVQFDGELAAYTAVVAHLREPLARWRLGLMRACLALLEGRFGDAAELADEALLIGRRGGHSEADFLHIVFQTYLAPLTGGDLAPAEAFVRQLVRHGPMLVRAWLASLLVEMDRLDEAAEQWAVLRSHLSEFPRYTPEWIVNTTSTVELCIRLDDRETLSTLYTDLLPFADGQATGGAHTPSAGPVALHLGKAATHLGDWPAAYAHLSAALDMCAAMGAAPHEAITRVELARLLLARKGPADATTARQQLEATLVIATRLGMTPLLARAKALHDRLTGGRSGPLSRREDEVAGLVAAGLTNRQIAERLFLSDRTVEAHVRSIFNKLGVESRASIASWHTARSRTT